MLNHLVLENFRNYDKFSVDFSDVTIFIGPNGIGKTNIIEAINLLSTGRSWRTNKDIEVIQRGKDFAKIAIDSTGRNNRKIEMVLQEKKTIKINEIKRNLSDLLGRLPTVLFSPEEINLVSGGPALRRRFLDILLCQIDHKYTLALLDLIKIIRGRNKLLFFIKIGKSKENELAFWDEKLIILGSYIIKKRAAIISDINKSLGKIYKDISSDKDILEILYKKNIEVEKIKEAIDKNRLREIEASTTLFGPHRDDFIFLLNGKDLSTFGSRGEYRSAVLALKVGELEVLKKEFEKKENQEPILLLDDIFSELDKERRMHLGKIVSNQQTIITTTDLDHIERGLREKAKIVELK